MSCCKRWFKRKEEIWILFDLGISHKFSYFSTTTDWTHLAAGYFLPQDLMVLEHIDYNVCRNAVDQGLGHWIWWWRAKIFVGQSSQSETIHSRQRCNFSSIIHHAVDIPLTSFVNNSGAGESLKCVQNCSK